MSSQDTPDSGLGAPAFDLRQQAFQDVINTIQRTGVGSRYLNRFQRRQANAGYTNDPSAGLDFTDPNFDQTRAIQALHRINRARVNSGQNAMRPGVRTNLINTQREQAAQAQRQQNYEQDYLPASNSAMDAIQGLLDKPNLSAGQVADIHARISNTIRGGLEQKQRAAAAALGVRGLDPGSAAGAAILARQSEAADADLANSLSQFDLNLSDLERQSTSSEATLLQSLATNRASEFAAIKDPSRLMELNDQFGSLLEALRVQKDTQMYQADLLRAALSRDWLGTGLNFLANAGQVAATGGAFSKGGIFAPTPPVSIGPGGGGGGGLSSGLAFGF